VVKLIVLLFALSPLLNTCQSLSSAAVDSAVVLRTRMPFVASNKPSGALLVAVVFVASTPVLLCVWCYFGIYGIWSI